jgi:nicotinate-nucleotide adenylyltransferase
LESDLSKGKVARIGFFGGSFDPIHLGHLNLALQMLETHKLDQVFFCPTSQNPLKSAQPPVASKEQRRAMVVAAIAPLPKFTFLDIEIQKSSAIYTIDSIRTLIKSDKEQKAEKKEYFLILGEDVLEGFHQWKEVEELILLASPLVGTRSGVDLPKTLPKPVAAAIKKGITKTSLMDISSTEIRRRMELGLYCGHLLPAKVWEYIQQNQLYSKPDEK